MTPIHLAALINNYEAALLLCDSPLISLEVIDSIIKKKLFNYNIFSNKFIINIAGE